MRISPLPHVPLASAGKNLLSLFLALPRAHKFLVPTVHLNPHFVRLFLSNGGLRDRQCPSPIVGIVFVLWFTKIPTSQVGLLEAFFPVTAVGIGSGLRAG